MVSIHPSKPEVATMSIPSLRPSLDVAITTCYCTTVTLRFIWFGFETDQQWKLILSYEPLTAYCIVSVQQAWVILFVPRQFRDEFLAQPPRWPPTSGLLLKPPTNPTQRPEDWDYIVYGLWFSRAPSYYLSMIQIYTNLTLITSDWHRVIKPNVEVICFISIPSPPG